MYSELKTHATRLILVSALTTSFVSALAQKADLSKYDKLVESSDMTITIKNEKYGVINGRGIEVAPPHYDAAFHFIQGAYGKLVKDRKMGIIDTNGRWIVPLQYDEIEYNGQAFTEVNGKIKGAFIVKKDNKWGVINTEGTMIMAMEHGYFSGFVNGFGTIYKETYKEGVINGLGQMITPMIYEDISEPQDGFAAAKKNGKWGFISTSTGKEIVSFKYDWAYKFFDGRGSVKIGEREGFVDSTGREVIPVIYEDVSPFSEGFAAVKKNGKWGFVDLNGNIIVPLEYDEAYSFKNESWNDDGPRGKVKKRNTWYYVDTKGNIVE